MQSDKWANNVERTGLELMAPLQFDILDILQLEAG
jgi:hypothetical protein